MLFRVSEAESFRQWQNDEEAELENLLTWLREDNPSEAMKAGTALHKALEMADVGDFQTLEAMGYTFHFQGDLDIVLRPVREVRLSKDYGGITITGQVDGLEGLCIDDHKSTSRFDPDRYLSGYQWRFYLDIFQCNVFRWNVLEMKQEDEREYTVFASHRLEQYRYPGLENDCRLLAHQLRDFAIEHMPERLR